MNRNRNTSTYRITDHTTGAVLKGIERHHVAAALKCLFPRPPVEVTDVCDELQAKLLAGDYYGDLEAALSVDVTREGHEQ